MKYTYMIIGDYPPSLNKYLGSKNPWLYRTDKKKWAKIVGDSVLAGTCPNFPIPKSIVKLTYLFPNKQRRDADNYSGKMILDPLVAYGVIADDSFQNIQLILHAEFACAEKGLQIDVVPIQYDDGSLFEDKQ